MRRDLTLSLGAVLAFVCLYYRGDLLLLPIFLLPVAAHELSHVLALRLLGRRITSFRFGAQGFVIAYAGAVSPLSDALAALAGPLGGAVYVLLADRAGTDWLKQSAGVSLLLTAFNLLPILPLDGGRVFLCLCASALGEARGKKLYRAVSAALLALFLLAGVYLAHVKKASAPLSAGIWLLLLQNEEESLVKSGGII